VAVAAAAVVAFSGAVLLEPSSKRRRLLPGEKKRPEGFDWILFSSTLDNAEYMEAFRMDRTCMEDVVSRIGAELQADANKQRFALSGCNHVITARQRLCVALRWFAGGQRVDIRRIYAPISKGEFSRAIWAVVDAANGEYANEHFMLMLPKEGRKPRNKARYHAQLSRNEVGFRRMSKSQHWRGQVGALDGCIIPMEGTGDTSFFCSRKKCHALLLMAIADADRRFIWWSMEHGPKTHDSTAWKGTEMGAQVCCGRPTGSAVVASKSCF
jgi:hypothetical protein